MVTKSQNIKMRCKKVGELIQVRHLTKNESPIGK